jgi:hypothetical protein
MADGLSAAELQARRLKTVGDHMRHEVAGEFEEVLATFEHPRYEVFGSGATYDGRDEVLRYFAEWFTPFPDFGGELISLRHTDDAVLCEVWVTGTHTGELQMGGKSHKPTGRAFRVRSLILFEFPPGGDKLACERIYFQEGVVRRQLGIA